MTPPDHRADVVDYHDRTKHDFHRFAKSLGHLDWANQPNPFRRFEGAPLTHLAEVPPSPQPGYDRLFGSDRARSPAPLDARAVAQLCYDSFALSAWKVAGDSRWSLRANPSSGNLHPTEAYLLSGPIEGLFPGAALGWEARLLETIGDRELGQLLAVDRQGGFEAEHPDGLLAVWTGSSDPVVPESWPDPRFVAEIREQPTQGEPNRLSHDHQPWPIIDAVAAACEKPALNLRPTVCPALIADHQPARPIGARQVIRQRRSAVAMDGVTSITLATFLCQLSRTLSHRGNPVWRAWPWPVSVHLALFVHRVEGLSRGLYWLDRDLSSPGACRARLRADFAWERPAGCPETLPLHRLREGDFGEATEAICCQQAIAGDGAYAVAMVAVMEKHLNDPGPWFYRRLFWECGMIGQILYLEAEAAGVRATGIGCYFDDPTHQLLGIEDHGCQSLYHFTVGGPVEDRRLQHREAYFHHKGPPSTRSLWR